MEKLRQLIARLQQGSNLQLIMGLGLAIVTLLLLAVIGAFAVGDDPDEVASRGSTEVEAGEESTDTTLSTTDPSLLPTESTVPGGAPAPGGTTARRPGAAAAPKKTVGGGGVTRNDLVSEPGKTREGVTETEIRWGIHAPQTFGDIPVDFAKNPIEGVNNYVDYINAKGGIHGRKIKHQVYNDRYEVEGAKRAADQLIDGLKPFFASGTLGVDQVAIVAAKAKERKVPYLAGGGSESEFKKLGSGGAETHDFFQTLTTYDAALVSLAKFLGNETKRPGSPYFGLKNVGVSRLDSQYIKPSVETTFKQALEQQGLKLAHVVVVNKPTEQTNYGAEINELKSNPPTEMFVPAQDPLTTSRQVDECIAQRCTWKYVGSNFAHESNTALKLMKAQWNGVLWLAGACYYLDPRISDTAKCAAMNQARERWIAQKGERDWQEKGQDGAAGYQLTHIWLKALLDAGADPTRERFVAALKTYNNYSDLVTGPITYAGRTTYEKGNTKSVLFQAGVDAWKQIGPGHEQF